MREAARQIGLSHTALQKAVGAGRIARTACGGWDVDLIRVQMGAPVAALRGQPAPAKRPAKLAAQPAPRPIAPPAARPPVAQQGPSMREIARQVGISHTALQKAERNGRIAREPDGSWDIEKVRAGLATRAALKPRKPYGSRAPWARAAHHIAKIDADIVGPARNIHKELETARQALERAARQIAALYPEILRLERACDAAIAAQEKAAE
ncbi:hypothetical protein [Roseomonas sp. AR75]|uniref:hypothetical protein n=1 Tax=Roseomonas sp. AR75 TaxID=2562311 RepID=UPI0010C0B01C|nr:hypothetical protein [Roseomonas sp. AR75]